MTKQVPLGYKQIKVGVIPEDWKIRLCQKFCVNPKLYLAKFN